MVSMFVLLAATGALAPSDEIRLMAPEVGVRTVATVPATGDCSAVRVDVPIWDVQEMWMPSWLVPRQDRKWALGATSAPQADVPFVAYFNEAGRNAFAIGADVLTWDTRIESKINQEKGVWEVTLRVVAGAGGTLRPFAVTLDRRDCDWQRAFADWRVSLGYPRRNYPDAAWKPVYCTWYAVHAALTQDWVERMAALAADLGFRTFILDDGWSYDEAKRVNPETLATWYRDTGTWDSFSRRKFPDFKAHRARMRALGLKYLVWVAPYFVGTRSEAYAKGGFAAKGLVPFEGNVLADPLDGAFMGSVDDQLVRLLKTADLDGLKIDFLDAIPPSVERPRGVASFAYVSQLMAKLRAVRPDGLFEFRQSYATPLMASLATQFRAGDVPFEWLANLLRIAQVRVMMGDGVPIHADPICWADCETPDNVNRHFLATMAGVPMLSMDLERLSSASRATVRRWLAFYATHVEAFQRTGAWHVEYRNGGVAAITATRDDEALLIANDPAWAVRLARQFVGKRLIVLNLTYETLDLGGGFRVPPAEAGTRGFGKSL